MLATKGNPYIDKIHWIFNEYWKSVHGVPKNILDHPLFLN
jgi:hypothetical protein